MPRSRGSRSCSWTSPRLTSHSRLWPVVVSSSRPSSPRKTSAVAPRVRKTPVMSGTRSRCATPTALASARAGLHSGPRKLKTVGTPSSARVGPAWRKPGWKAAANANVMPARVSVSATASGVSVRSMPSAAEHVGRSRRRARGLVAVLDDGDPGCRGHDRRHRRDVHRPEAVAAGAHDVEHRRVDRQRQRRLEDRVAEADDLVDRLALGAQRDEEAGELRRRRLARHDLPHRPRRLRDAEVLAARAAS